MSKRFILATTVATLIIALLWWLRGAPTNQPSGAEGTALRAHRRTPPSPSTAPPRSSSLPPAPVRMLRAETHADESAVRGAFGGTVLDSLTGARIEGAELTFEGALGVESTTTDGNGRFRFEPSDAGGYRLAAVVKDGYLPYAPALGESPIELRPHPRQLIDGLVVYLEPARALLGRVVDADGKAVAHAAITIVDDGSNETTLAALRPHSDPDSDEHGEFRVRATIGTVIEASDADRHGRAVVDREIQRRGELVIALTNTLTKTATIGGRVVDERDNGIDNAEVLALAPGSEPAGGRARTDEEGRFLLTVLADRDYQIRARADERAPALLAATAGARDLVLVLGPDARITGTVVDEAGAPLPSFHIAVLEQQGPMFLALVTHTSVVSSDGRFEVRGLAPGSYQVVATAYGMAPSAPSPATASATPASVTVTLVAGTTVHGTVLDATTRRPLSRAQVSMESSLGGRGTTAVPLVATALTDDQGHFELEGLTPDRASLVVEAAGHHSRIVGGLDASAGPRIGPITVELSAIDPGDVAHVELAGIGAVIAGAETGLRIDRVLPGSGAAEVGLGPGDVIVTVDGARTLELGFEASLQRLRGPVGTTVELGVARGDDEHTYRVPRLAIRL